MFHVKTREGGCQTILTILSNLHMKLVTLTETVLLQIKNEIHLSLSCGGPTALVLHNMSAVFSTIDTLLFLIALSHGSVRQYGL